MYEPPMSGRIGKDVLNVLQTTIHYHFSHSEAPVEYKKRGEDH